MNPRKMIIIGSSLADKTTIVRRLRQVVDWPIGEIDEEILNRNNGVWPEMEYKNTVIVPAIIEEVLRADSLVFFTNTGYFSIDDLAMAKKRGFMIVQML